MAYFKIGNTDFSSKVNKLDISTKANYIAETNALGNTVVDYINSKRVIKVGIICLSDADAQTVLNAVSDFSLTISYLAPDTKALATVNVILPEKNLSYYTIQSGNTKLKAFELTFIEL